MSAESLENKLITMESQFLNNPECLPFSPVTSLALNLSDTFLSPSCALKRKRPHLEESPVSIPHHPLLLNDMTEATTEENLNPRLLTKSIRLNSNSKFRDGILHPPRALINDKWNIENANNKENMITGKITSPHIESSTPLIVLNKYPSSPRSIYPRQPLEDHDPNSQDSGYHIPVYIQESNITHAEPKMGFRFAEPIGAAPRRFSDSPERPRKSLSFNTQKSSSSTESADSLDDGFIELLSESDKEEDVQLHSFNTLFSAPLKPYTSPMSVDLDEASTPSNSFNMIVTSPSKPSDGSTPNLSSARSLQFNIRQPLRRMLSHDANSTPTTSQGSVRSHLFHGGKHRCLSQSPNNSPSLEFLRAPKRSEPCHNSSQNETYSVKRRRPTILENENDVPKSPCSTSNLTAISATDNNTEETNTPNRLRLHRFFSENDASIDLALQRSAADPDLIGDFTRPFALPLMAGRHEDLKSISCHTLADLLLGKFDDQIESFTIVDCRYPYEYKGGHIRGAKNIYTRDQIYKELIQVKDKVINKSGKRHILIFHCEFSSERGPSLSRFLRNSDRDKNEYPTLYYPELYLLHGGYKDFFEHHSQLCEPISYLPMLDPRYECDLKHFRSKSKSWNGDSKTRIALRHNLKRLGL